MRKILFTALLAATALPTGAMAQDAQLHRDRQEIRQDHRDVQRARETGDPRYVHEQRRELRDNRQDYRHDARDYGRDDWRGYRNGNRELYARGNWRADFGYRAFAPGVRITTGYYAPRYYVNDYARYRLPRPGYNQRWVRHYNDVLLVDVRSGIVVDVLRNFYR